MAEKKKKKYVSTSRADRTVEQKRRIAKVNKPFERVETNRLYGPAPRKFMGGREPTRSRLENSLQKVRWKTVEGVSYPILWGTNYGNFRSQDSRDRKFDANKTRTSKLRRTSTRFGDSPDLSKAAGGAPTRRQRKLTVARAENNRQRAAAKAAGRKRASAAKRRER
jgi:hypothetical protein